jgi:signal transduction histidine kinase
MDWFRKQIFSDYLKISLIISLVTVITLLHYLTRQDQNYLHIFLRELYFFPILLAAFWYGLRGGIITSVVISVLYVPLVSIHWQEFSPEDLNKSLEIVLFNMIALLMGILSDREKKREQEKRETILAMAGTIAHELNSPIQVVLGYSQLLQDDFEPESESYKDIQSIINNTKEIQQVVRKISFLDQFNLTEYAGGDKIIDISPRKTK